MILMKYMIKMVGGMRWKTDIGPAINVICWIILYSVYFMDHLIENCNRM